MLTNLFRPVVSGSATQSEALAKQLVKRGNRVVVITAHVERSAPSYEETDGVHVYRLPAIKMPKLPISLNFPWLSWTFTPGNLRRVEAVLRRHRAEIVHLHNHMFDLAFSAVVMRRRLGIPLVIGMHTIIRHTTAAYNVMLYPADRLFIRCAVVEQAEMLLCPDTNAVHYAREAFPRTPRVLIPYGVELPEQPSPGRVAELRRRHGLEGKRVILSLGHVHDVRNRRDEVRALAEVLKVFPDVVLLIVGAETTDIPRRLAKELGVGGSVIFAGHAPHSDVPTYLAMAELEVHLFYQDTEEKTSLGIASLEAMAAGRVVISAANRNTYGPDLLRSGENIVLVERGKPARLAQAIIGLLADEEKRRRMGKAAARFVRSHFGWDDICQRTLEVYGDARRRYRGAGALWQRRATESAGAR